MMLFPGHLLPGGVTGIYRRSTGSNGMQKIRRLVILRSWKVTTIRWGTAGRIGSVLRPIGSTLGPSQTVLQQNNLSTLRVLIATDLLVANLKGHPFNSDGHYEIHASKWTPQPYVSSISGPKTYTDSPVFCHAPGQSGSDQRGSAATEFWRYIRLRGKLITTAEASYHCHPSM